MKKFHSAVIMSTGVAVSDADITIYEAGTATKATIFSDEGITERDNPFKAETNGRFEFYVADGDYDIQISGSGITTYKLLDVTIVDGKEAAVSEHSHSNKIILDAIQEAFTTTLKDKLNGIEDLATIDQTATEIRDLLDALTGDSRLPLSALKETDIYKYFTATLKTKLDGIEAGAVALATVKADADVADAISKKHTQNSDTHLGTVDQNISLNSHKITSLADGADAGDAVNKGQLDAKTTTFVPIWNLIY